MARMANNDAGGGGNSESEAIQPGKIEIWAEVTLSVTLVSK
jgi:hypothetical protein